MEKRKIEATLQQLEDDTRFPDWFEIIAYTLTTIVAILSAYLILKQ